MSPGSEGVAHPKPVVSGDKSLRTEITIVSELGESNSR